MIIVELNGGLGNQIAQYIFSRYLEEIYGYENVLLDDSFYYFRNKCHNGFELNKIFPNIKLNLLSNYFENDVWEHMMQTFYKNNTDKSNPRLYKTQDLFMDQGIEMALVADEFWCTDNKFKVQYSYDGTVYMVKSREFNSPDCDFKEKFAQHSNIYFMGVWLKDFFGDQIKEKILHELKLPPFVHQENINYVNKICSSGISIGVHVRRGDFITANKILSNDKFAIHIKHLKTKLTQKFNRKINFFIFSDDIPWCKDNIYELGVDDKDNITFIVGNDVDQRNYLDMQLMSYCDFLIHNYNSSFCPAAKVISKKNIAMVICG